MWPQTPRYNDPKLPITGTQVGFHCFMANASSLCGLQERRSVRQSVRRTIKTKATIIGSESETWFFDSFRRLLLPGTLKDVPRCLNDLLVNFREESSGIGRFCRLEVPTDGQLAAQFRPFYRNWVNCTKQAVCFEQFSQFRFFHRSWASWPFVGIRAYKIGQSHWIPLENRPAAHWGSRGRVLTSPREKCLPKCWKIMFCFPIP